ncbi:hypothetical protein [Vibrio neptunius]|uniref:hypothetical protein n=1 Tax=Vibrio neptunius TaxID=170651 RepID=UPI003CE4D38B
MKILYFDAFSLFYSREYIRNDKEISHAYQEWRNASTFNLFKVVTPDLAAIERLRCAAIESGFMLYPLGNKYTRTLFIESGLFAENELAPDVTLKIRLDDTDPIRMMIAHAYELNASWYVCGDCGPDLVNERYLASNWNFGVTDELLSKIRALNNIC